MGEKQRIISAIAAAKDADAWVLRQQGLTYAAIGLRMGISPERVRQRIRKHERKIKRQQELENGNHRRQSVSVPHAQPS